MPPSRVSACASWAASREVDVTLDRARMSDKRIGTLRAPAADKVHHIHDSPSIQKGGGVVRDELASDAAGPRGKDNGTGNGA